ncbi:MAG: 3'-5' exonuclease [Methanomassiliicoccaceae archaeon]|jgi:DNA polymerase-3 subunit epsilon|nr:3'-5' exonuclease [Methanomassiliicoccaceae archaeon]
MSTLDDFCKTEVYVIDTETTGLDGAPADRIVDIAICRVALGDDKVETVYSSVVGHDTSRWSEKLKRSWIFENTDLTLDTVDRAPPEEHVVRDVTRILSGANVTSFNTQFDFDKFLYKAPWSLRGRFTQFRCIMMASKNVCRLPGLYDDYKYPKLEEAYRMIVKGDPANIGGKQAHRALSDAVMASHILIELHRTGNY